MAFTVATQNLWGRVPLWHLRKRAIARTLRDADVVVMQEVQARGPTSSQAHDLARHLGLPHARFASAGNTLGWREGVGIASRWPILHLASQKLPQRRNNLIDRAAPRLVLRAVLQTPIGTLEVYALHLSLSEKSRTASAKTVVAFAQRERGIFPIDFTLIAGDFNARPDEPCLQAIKAACDVRELDAGHMTFPAYWPMRRLDYLLVSPTLRARIIRTAGSAGSDHCALIAEVEPYII